ncbi:PEP/pyruvate-binding domain-containing protein [Paenibacillus cremeus]|uniref:Phosphoenolpyruvate synthase n=1 Tax=Paenibacillus cremeus TaxID=2163881 RepID=A0A559JKE1_9BACL|nr:PEP/pyruvate-binding domain-containing protein [Paenibacillus cremeus]TVY00342.1 pyruvate-binding protein [Paenibacillus cremeus]
MFTISLDQASQESLRRIGSKALQLARMMELDVGVPGGFVVTAEALDRFIAVNGLLIEGTWSDYEERLLQAEIPEEIGREVAMAYEQLLKSAEVPDNAVAVRSSSSAEDLAAASFAGQYETILNVTDLPHVLGSLKRCWASLFSARVREYAAQKCINWNMNDLPMGVLVQLMVAADVSGVLFSMNPVTQNSDEIVINASYGLGEAVVSGLVTPDTYFIGKSDRRIRKELGLKELKVVAGAIETMELETTEEEQCRFCLEEEQIGDLVEQTLKLEKYFGHPVDLEFAMKNGKMYILQARPVTT